MKRQSIFVINELYKSYQSLSEETKRKYFPGAEQQYVAVMESFSKINQKDYLKTILDNTQLYVSLYTFIVKALQDGYEILYVRHMLQENIPEMFKDESSAISALAFVILNMNYHEFSMTDNVLSQRTLSHLESLMLYKEPSQKTLFEDEIELIKRYQYAFEKQEDHLKPSANKFLPTLYIPNAAPNINFERYSFLCELEFLLYIKTEKPKTPIIWDKSENYRNKFHYAVKIYREGHYEEAISHFRKVIELNPVRMNERFYLIDCYFKLGQIDVAEKELHATEKYITQERDKISYYKSLGYIFEHKGLYSEAAYAYANVLNYKSDDRAESKLDELLAKYKLDLSDKQIDIDNAIKQAGGCIFSRERSVFN